MDASRERVRLRVNGCVERDRVRLRVNGCVESLGRLCVETTPVVRLCAPRERERVEALCGEG